MRQFTDRLNRRTIWLAILVIVLIVWGLTDVRHRARTDPHHLSAHRTDFTVYTAAGAAMFDGRDPYTVSNPRGWHYLYPPLFAILVAPLSGLDSQWQAVIWYAISLLMLWGCYTESRRIWRWLCSPNTPHAAAKNFAANDAPQFRNSPSLPAYIFWLAGATVLLPALNCLQRGQVGILLTYLLLLGFRCVLTSRSIWSALAAGIVLALPVAIKVIPALPVGILCLQLLAAAGLHHWRGPSTKRAIGVSFGTVVGLLLYLLVIPSLAIGPSTNAKHLNTWVTKITNMLLNEEGKTDDIDFSVHTKRNPSLTNAVYRLGNWAAHVFAGTQDDQLIDAVATRDATMPMDNPWAERTLQLLQLGLLALLLRAGWAAARRDDALATAAVFSLACLLMSAISPVFRGHYYVLWLPAAWLLPLYCWHLNRTQLATSLAVAACALTWTHYLLLEWAGRVGVLGLGTTLWYVVATVSVLYPARKQSRSLESKARPRLYSVDHDLTVLIPAFNEEDRLRATLHRLRCFFDLTAIDYRVLVIDDGSQDSTATMTQNCGPRFNTLRLPVNQGKGAAVREGILAATGAIVAFTDADLPYDLRNIVEGYELIRHGECEAAFGARNLFGATVATSRRFSRRVASACFSRITKSLISSIVTDTQCGLKLFSRSAARAIFSRSTLDGFAFDTEVVYLTHRLNIPFRRIPVSLVNDHSSTVSLLRHVLPMLVDVVKVRYRHRKLIASTAENEVSVSIEPTARLAA